MSIARRAALGVLLGIEAGHTTLAAEVDRARRDVPDVRDRGLLLELTAGTLRWRASLDRLIEARGGKPIASFDPPVRGILRLSAFQLEHLERVPARAVLHDAVDMARAEVHEGAAGLVNAVLRNITRGGPDPRPALPAAGASREDELDYLSITLSHPRWLVRRWLDRHGFDAARAWCTFNNQPPAISIRPAGGAGARDLFASLIEAGVAARRARFAERAITLDPGALGRMPAELRASVVVQDEGSQLVALVAAAGAGDLVLDLCASPGGKTRLLRDLLPPDARLVASDHRRSRVARLRAALREDARDVPIVQLDGRRLLPFGPVFSTVLVDAPCSGVGVLARDPDVKWSRAEDDLASFASVQHDLLSQAAAVVRPGGRLVYATCSSEPDENWAVVERFLADGRFTLTPAGGPASSADPLVIDERGCLRTRPDLHGLDAFFAAVLVQREAT